MVQVGDLTELTLRDLWREVKDENDWWGELKGQTMRLVKRFLESAMDEEILEHVRVRRYQRSEVRRGYRNGYRYRSLLAEFGLLEEIRVPRDREGSYRPGVLPRYRRRQRQVDRMVREMFLSGVSTRRVQEVVTPLESEEEETLPVEPEQLGEGTLGKESVTASVGQSAEEGLWVSLIEDEEA